MSNDIEGERVAHLLSRVYGYGQAVGHETCRFVFFHQTDRHHRDTHLTDTNTKGSETKPKDSIQLEVIYSSTLLRPAAGEKTNLFLTGCTYFHCLGLWTKQTEVHTVPQSNVFTVFRSGVSPLVVFPMELMNSGTCCEINKSTNTTVLTKHVVSVQDYPSHMLNFTQALALLLRFIHFQWSHP